MNQAKLIFVSGLVRIKPGALLRLGLYLRRAGYARVLEVEGVEAAGWAFASLPRKLSAIVGLGGGRASFGCVICFTGLPSYSTTNTLTSALARWACAIQSR